MKFSFDKLRISFMVLMSSLALVRGSNHIAWAQASAFIERPADRATVIRLFYLPLESYLHPALIFRVAEKAGQLGTAPITNMGGRTPYVSLPEMEALRKALAQSGLVWRRAKKIKPVSPIPTKEMGEDLEISVFLSPRPMQAHVAVQQLCETLATFDPALLQPRALWEFQLFRVDYAAR